MKLQAKHTVVSQMNQRSIKWKLDFTNNCWQALSSPVQFTGIMLHDYLVLKPSKLPVSKIAKHNFSPSTKTTDEF